MERRDKETTSQPASQSSFPDLSVPENLLPLDFRVYFFSSSPFPAARLVQLCCASKMPSKQLIWEPESSQVLLLDFQGKFDLSSSTEAVNLLLGRLSFPTSDKPVFMVGSHRLQGRQVVLKKPLVLVERATMRIKSVIRSKLLFDSRPSIVFKSSH